MIVDLQGRKFYVVFRYDYRQVGKQKQPVSTKCMILDDSQPKRLLVGEGKTAVCLSKQHGAPDQFNRAVGRKISLQRALRWPDRWDRAERTQFWQAYFQNHRS